MTQPTLEAWVLYDATTDVKYIKMNPLDGSLAIFDTEEAAMEAKRLTYGTDYERCEYYSAPQPTPEVAKLVEALEEMIYVAEMVDSFPFYPIERAEEALAIYRQQGGDL